MKWQARCIIPDCKSVPSTICAGCTRDVRGIVFVCKPSPRKRCWDILHQARSPKLLDAQGNEIEPATLIKRKRNNSLGVERIPKRQRKSLFESSSHSVRLKALLCFFLCQKYLKFCKYRFKLQKGVKWCHEDDF